MSRPQLHGLLPYFDQRTHQHQNQRRFGRPSNSRIYDDAAGDFLFCMDTANSSNFHPAQQQQQQQQQLQGTIDNTVGDNVDISLTAPPFAQ